MSLLSVSRSVARNIGVEAPETVMLNTDPDCQSIYQYVNEAGREIARRVDWSALKSSTVVTGTGSDIGFTLPDNFARLILGNAVSVNGMPVRGGLSADEFASISPAEGVPRYFLLQGRNLLLHPFPAFGTVVNVTYQTLNWTPSGASYSADTEVALIPEELIEMGGVWRWKRHIGADYQDFVAEFEAALSDLASSEGGVRLP